MAKLFPYAFFQEFDDQGDPLAGGKLYSYEAGTSTPKTTYSDSDGATPNANPVVFDSYGRANVWLGDGSYKFILKDADDNTIYTVDNIGGDSAAAFGSTVTEISGNLSVTEVYANAVITATAAATLSLLPAATAGEGFYFVVKNAHASASVTLDPDLSETIDGVATVTIGPGQSALVITNGTTWRTMFLATVSATGNNTLSGSNTFTGKVLLPTDGELTIATGAVTVTGAFHTIDTESDAASDDLDTISGGADGQVLQIRADNDARTVVVKHNTGNIYNPGAADISLDNYYNVLNLRYDGTLTKWVVINNTASETVPGNVELATTAEVIAGDATRAATGAGVLAARNLILLATYNPSAVAQLDITSIIDGTYDVYQIEVIGLKPASDADMFLRTSTNNGASFNSGASDYICGTHLLNGVSGSPGTTVYRSAGTSAIDLSGGYLVESASGFGWSGTLTIYKPSSTSLTKLIRILGDLWRSTTEFCTVTGCGVRTNTAAINAVRLFFGSSVNIDSGTVKVYGVR
jgi:hypothetical protein